MGWEEAVARADRMTNEAPGWYQADTWDGRAIRGVLAVTLAGLARRLECTVEEIELGSLMWHLDQGPELVYELGKELGLNREDAQPEAAATEWAWLIRRWPSHPPLANSDGMPRGIGRGSNLPAVEACTMWALSVVRDALVAERPAGLQPGTRVRVTGGEDEGREGTVLSPAWLLDDEQRTVEPGPPSGYEVRLKVADEPEGPQRTVMESPMGDIVIEAPAAPGERVIIRARDLAVADG
ncbi:hypothetical protein ACMATS_06165 [Streptoverticillium reticulum]|uniref:hypothetical protein n=1 Tax=Streptoverticillium reticulum TaxID=1433415 RepID=UPI0039BF9AA2